MELDELALDWKSETVLVALYEADGEATTTELSTLTGIEKNDHILYRFREKLVPAGLVETEKGEATHTPIPPTVATLTDSGEKVAAQLREKERRVLDIGERIEQVAADVNQLESRVESIEGEGERRDENRPALSEELESISDDVDTLTNRLDALWEGMAVMRDYIQEEHDVDLRAYKEEHEIERAGPE
jgi:predicted nuclease with TOPRIM domain